MPVQTCASGGKPGYRWGSRGKCFTYESGNEAQKKKAKQKAILQGAAIGMNDNHFAFEPFGKVDPSKPYKIIPMGTWYRGDRKLDITRKRLQEMETNFKRGLPRYRPAVNLNHAEDQGKVGNITDVRFMDQGPEGPGLYVEFELTDKGLRAVEQDGYDGISAEINWSLNGSAYQDPKSGESYDNVLVGMGLTPYPYFGHEHVALYTADKERAFEVVEVYRPFGGATSWDQYDEWAAAQDLKSEIRMNTSVLREMIDNVLDDDSISNKGEVIANLADGYQARVDMAGKGEDMSLIQRIREAVVGAASSDYFKEFSPERRRQLAKKGFALPDGSFPIESVQDLKNAIKAVGRTKNRAAAIKHIKKRARALGATDLIPDNWSAGFTGQEDVKMPKKDKEKEALEQERLEKEEAERAEAEKAAAETVTVEQLSEDLKAASKRADRLEAELKAERMARRKADLRQEAETFKALGIKTDEYVERMVALEDQAPELAEWLREKFGAFDKALVEAGLLREIGSGQEANLTGPDRYIALVKAKVLESFSGDMSKWTEAMESVSAEYPDMAREYAASIQ